MLDHINHLINWDHFYILLTPKLFPVAVSTLAYGRWKVGGIKPLGRQWLRQAIIKESKRFPAGLRLLDPEIVPEEGNLTKKERLKGPAHIYLLPSLACLQFQKGPRLLPQEPAGGTLENSCFFHILP